MAGAEPVGVAGPAGDADPADPADPAGAAGVLAADGEALLPPEVQPASMPTPSSADAVSAIALARERR